MKMCDLNSLRCSVNEQLDAAGNEIFLVLEQSQNQCGAGRARVFVRERLTAAASEICVVVERVIMKYRQDMARYRLLDIALKPYVNLQRADAKQLLVCRQEWSPSLDQEEAELPHIKVEQEDLWTSQKGEQLQGLNETDIKVIIKSEYYRETLSPQSICLDQSETKTGDRDDDWMEPGVNADAKQLLVCKQECSSSLDQEEPELPHSEEGEQLQGLNETDMKSENYRETLSPQSICSDQSETKSEDSDDDWMEPGLNTGSPSVTVGEDRTLHSSVASQTITTSGKKLSRARSHHCKQCGKSFSYLSVLKTHQRVHTGEKIHHCQQCDKSFSYLSVLKTHQRVHNGEKPYHCQQCEKSFTQLSLFQRHQRVHNGEKPYLCQQCGKGFSDARTRHIHQRDHTSVNLVNEYIRSQEMDMSSTSFLSMMTKSNN